MNKNTLNEILHISRDCLYHFWQKDVEFIFPYCAQDVAWIGSMQSQFLVGLDAMKEDFYQIQREMQPCHLRNQQFVIVQNSGNTCTVIGQYLTTTDEDADFQLQAPQRCTFVWELIDKQPKIRHLHVSNALGEMAATEGELFVNSMGNAAKRYIEKQIRSQVKPTKITGEDVHGRIHFLLSDEILYISALKKNVIVHTPREEIEIRKGYSKLLTELGEAFVEVHRGEAVNIDYIS